MKQQVLFRITWLPATPLPSLRYLVHNNQAIDAHLYCPLPNGVEVQFECPMAPFHLMAWGLEAPGTEIKALKAVASIDQGPVQELKAVEVVLNVWTDQAWI